MRSIGEVVITLICLGALFLAGYYTSEYLRKPVPTPIIVSSKEVNEDVLWDKVQQWKLDNGGEVYTKHLPLCEYARARAIEASKNWSHGSFESDNWLYRAFGFYRMGENLAKGFPTEAGTLQGWLDSESHKLNLEDSFQFSCIACENGVCAQEFASY